MLLRACGFRTPDQGSGFVQAARSSIENATFTPFSYRGRGSALRSQKTSCSPLELRLVSEGATGGAIGFADAFENEFGFAVADFPLALEAFLGGGAGLHENFDVSSEMRC